MKFFATKKKDIVGALTQNIWIQNPFKIPTFWCLDFWWFGIRMIGTVATALVPTIQKWNQYVGKDFKIYSQDMMAL